jgi:hypothetical protein
VHTVFVTCILSLLSAYCLRNVNTIFVTWILSSLRAYCVYYVNTVFVTWILALLHEYDLRYVKYDLRYVHTVFVTWILTSLREYDLRYVTPLLLPAATAADSSNSVTNTRCCRYSCMRSWWWMEVHPKHVEQFPDINKLCNVASCWIYIAIYSRTLTNLPLCLTDGHKNASLIGNRFLPSLKPITYGTMQCSCKPLTIMCCHHRKPRESNIFHVLNN